MEVDGAMKMGCEGLRPINAGERTKNARHRLTYITSAL